MYQDREANQRERTPEVNPNHTTAAQPRKVDDVAAMISAALDAAGEDTLRRVAKAALEESGRQRTNAFRVGLPGSPPYKATVRAAEHFEEALIGALGGWPSVERALGSAAPRPRADPQPA